MPEDRESGRHPNVKMRKCTPLTSAHTARLGGPGGRLGGRAASSCSEHDIHTDQEKRFSAESALAPRSRVQQSGPIADLTPTPPSIMSTSDSGAPPPSTRKLVLRKIVREVSFPPTLGTPAPREPSVRSASGSSHPPHPPPLRPPTPRLPHPQTSVPEVNFAVPLSAPTQRDSLARLVAPPSAPLPPTSGGSIATPMPSRVSVPPFVASVPPPMNGRSTLDVTPKRSILVAATISVACVLVGGGVLLRAHLDESESGMPANARAQPVAVAVPATAAPIAVVPAPSRGPASMFPPVPTANVNDLPRAPPTALKRSLPSAAAIAAAAARSAARKATVPTPPASPDDEIPAAAATAPAATAPAASASAAAEATATPEEPAASADKPTDPSPDDTAPSSAAAAPPPADPLLLEMQKAVGGDAKK
jgi:hypothetical protein